MAFNDEKVTLPMPQRLKGDKVTLPMPERNGIPSIMPDPNPVDSAVTLPMPQRLTGNKITAPMPARDGSIMTNSGSEGVATAAMPARPAPVEEVPSIYGGKYFTEPFVKNDVGPDGKSTGGRTSNIFGALKTGLSNAFGIGGGSPAAAPAQPASAPAGQSAPLPSVDQVMADANRRAEVGRAANPVNPNPVQNGGNVTIDARPEPVSNGTVNSVPSIDERAASDFNPDGSVKYERKPEQVWVGGQLKTQMPLAQARAGGFLTPDQSKQFDARDVEKQKADALTTTANTDQAYKSGLIGIEGPYKKGLIDVEKTKAEGSGALNAAHANAYNAEAGYHRAMSDPAYLMQKQNIALLKDAGERKKAEDALTGHKLTSMGADLTDDNVNLLRGYEKESAQWGARAAKSLDGLHPSIQQPYADALQKFVYATPAEQKVLATSDPATQDMLRMVQKRDPSVLKRPVFPTTFRPAKQLTNIPSIQPEG